MSKFLLLGICLLAGFHAAPFAKCDAAAETSQPVISDIQIEIDWPYGDPQPWLKLAKALLHLQTGEPFSESKLQESIAALKQSRQFEDIFADSRTEADAFVLLLRLKPQQRVKDIGIKGAYPLFERDILNTMTIGCGDAFEAATLSEQSQLILQRLQRAGFERPEVQVTFETDASDGHVILHVAIHPGSYRQLASLEISVNRKAPDENIKLRMKTWRHALLPGMAGRFVAATLKADIDALLQYYRQKGYPEVTIDTSVESAPASGGICIALNINTGPQYNVRFSGNQTFREAVLKKDLLLFKEGNSKNDSGLRKSIHAIKNRYRQAGYSKTGVTVQDTIAETDEKRTRQITLHIDEGPRTTVATLSIEGNTRFSAQELRKQILSSGTGILPGKAPFIPETFDDDLNAVKLFYLRHGYLSAEITGSVEREPANESVHIRIRIEEGMQTTVGDLDIEGLTALPEPQALKALQMKSGQPFRNYMLKSDQNLLSALIAEKGYPHVRIRHTLAFNADRSRVSIAYAVDEGPQVKFGEIFVAGNFRTRPSVIQSELTIKSDTPFSLQALLENQRRLRNLAIFDSVSILPIGLKEKDETVNLLVEVGEKKPYFVEIGVGYENQTGLFANAKTGDRNLFGENKSARLEINAAQIGYRAELALEDYRFLNTPVTAAFTLFAEQKEEFNQRFGTRSYGSALGFNRKVGEALACGLRFQFENRKTFESDTWDPSEEDDSGLEEGTRSFFVTSPSIQYDTRDSFIRPRKGMLATVSVDLSKGIGESTDDFIKYRLDSRFFRTPRKGLTLAWLIRAGYIEGFGGNNDIPEDQLFYLGGTNSVRGFDENLLRFDAKGDPLGGRAALSGSLETRIDLSRNLELTLFYDTGSLGDNFEDLYSGDLQSSCGAGLRYITPIGPIGILYGHKLDRRDGEDPGQFHFSMGYTF